MQKYARYVPAVAAIVFLSVVMVAGFLIPSEKPEPHVPEEYTYEITAVDEIVRGDWGYSVVTVTLDRVPSTPLTMDVVLDEQLHKGARVTVSGTSVSFTAYYLEGYWREGCVKSSPDWFITNARDSAGYPVVMIRAQTVSV